MTDGAWIVVTPRKPRPRLSAIPHIGWGSTVLRPKRSTVIVRENVVRCLETFFSLLSPCRWNLLRWPLRSFQANLGTQVIHWIIFLQAQAILAPPVPAGRKWPAANEQAITRNNHHESNEWLAQSLIPVPAS